MLDLSLLPDGGLSWLDGSGPDSEVVLSTRVRLARNLAEYAFPHRATDEERAVIAQRIIESAAESRSLSRAITFELSGLESAERLLLQERHLVSREHAGVGGGEVRPGTVLVTQGDASVMANEEDHLRLQALWSGFALQEAYRAIEAADSELGARLGFAFHPEFGYLTTCPTNAGTGLRASVLIHLPGLVLTKEIGKVLQSLTQVGLTFRGLYGEGSEVVGNFFQLSNQTTLGKSEEELLDHLGRIVQQVVTYEEQARELLLHDAPTVIADKVWRAYALLRHGRRLSFSEAMNLLSGVRLGSALKLINGLSVYTLNKLLIFTQSAHLDASGARDVDDSDQAAARATCVRQLLEGEPVS